MTSSSTINRISLFGIILIFALASRSTSAQSQPQLLNVSGGLFNPNGTPIVSNSVAFKIEIMDKSATCVLYSEEHLAQDLGSTKGAFSLQVGGGSSPQNKIQGGPSLSTGLFLNDGATPPFTDCPTGVTLAAGDGRLIRISYNLGAGFVAMTPNVPLVSSAFAMVADTLRGKTPTDFVQVNATSAQLSQSNVENIFSNINYPKLTALLDGTSSQYMVSTPATPVNFNSQRLTGVADPTAAQDAATKNYADSRVGGKGVDVSGIGLGVGGGKTLVWDQALNQWVAQTMPGAMSGLVAGTGLLGGTITSYGTVSVDTGTTANKIVQLSSLAYLPAVDGHLLTNLQFPVSSVAGKQGVVTLVASDIGGLGTAATRDVGTGAGNLIELTVASTLPALDAYLLTNINATMLQSRAVAGTAPSSGQVLAWNNSALRWEPQNAAISGITDLTGDMTAVGPGSALATIAQNAVTSAKINNTGNLINRLLITDGTTGAAVTYATCSNNEVMKYSLATGWGCAADIGASGLVTAVTAGTGLVAGTISSTGTLNIDVGSTANKIVQLTSSAEYPQADGFLVTNINAVHLQARIVAATAPSDGQVLTWNNGSLAWEPKATGAPTDDSLNFDTFSDALLLDASTDISATGNNVLSITNSGTGDSFRVNDEAADTTPFVIDAHGNLGIGVETPVAKLEAQGQIVSRQNTIATGGAVDFNSGNVALLNDVGGNAITLSNMVPGGSYTVIIADPVQRTYTFTGCAVTYFRPANGMTAATSHTIYTILAANVSGSTYCYIAWITGFQ